MKGLDQIIEQTIKEQVALELERLREPLINSISEKLSKPKYMVWGRFLTPKQSMVYTGFKSLNGFKEMCRSKNISPARINKRVIRYDRNELDKINIKNSIQDYLNKF